MASKIKNLFPLYAVFFVFGCVPFGDTITLFDDTIFLPSGEKGYAINCRDSINQCYRQASIRCLGGYEIVKKTVIDGQKERFAAKSESASSAAATYTTYDFLIKCVKNKQKVKNERKTQNEKAKPGVKR